MVNRGAFTSACLLLAALALLALPQTAVAAPKLDEDLARAREILTLLEPQGEFETTSDYHARLRQYNGLLPELREISEREYTVPLELTAERYKPDDEYFPVTVSKEGLLEPAVGRLEMPISAARKANSKITRAWGAARVRASTGLAQAQPHLTSVYVFVGGKQWEVTFLAAWERGFTLPLLPDRFSFSVTPDGSTLLAQSGGKVLFVDLDSGVTKLSVDGEDCDVQDSHTAYVRQPGAIHFVDRTTWSVRESRRGPTATNGAYTSDGLLHVAWASNGDLVLWNMRQQKEMWAIRAYEGSISDGIFCGDGKFVATGSNEESGVRVWDVESGTLVRFIDKFGGAPVGVVSTLAAFDTHAYLAAGTVHLASGLGTHMFVWHVPSFRDAVSLHAPAGAVTGVTASSVSSAIMFTYTALPGLNVCNPRTGETVQTVSIGDGFPIQVSRKGNVLVKLHPGLPVETLWQVGSGLPNSPLPRVDIPDGSTAPMAASSSVPTPIRSSTAGAQDAAGTTTYPTNEAGMRSTITRAEEILNIARPKGEFESTPEYEARIAEYNALIPVLRAIAALRFDVPMTVEDVGRYDADAEAFPVTISKDGLLSAAKGTMALPRSKARSAKSQLRKAWASVQVRIVPATREAIPYPRDISVRFQNKMWPVEFPGAWVDGYSIRHLEVGQIGVSPDGRFLAAGMRNHARVYRLSDGAELLLLQPETALPDYIYSAGVLAFTNDGEHLIEGWDWNVRLWDTANGELQADLRLPTHAFSVAVHPDDDLVAIGGGRGDPRAKVYIWSISQGAVISEFEAQDTPIESLAFVEGGRFLVTGGGHTEPALHVWDAESWRHVRDLPNRRSANGKYGGVVRLDTYDDLHRLQATAWGTPVVTWDTEAWVEDYVSTHIARVLLDPDGETALYLDIPAGAVEVRVLSVSSQKAVQVISPPGMAHFKWAGGRQIWHVAPDGSTLAVAVADQPDGLIRTLWRVGADLPAIPIDPLALASPDSMVAAATPEQPTIVPPPTTPIPPVAVEPNPDVVTQTEPTRQETSAPTPGSYIRTHALLVGVDDYDSHANLINPVNDVRAIQAELRDVYGAGTHTLASPTRREFQEALHALADRDYGEQDQLLVMFSGHGYFDERIKRGYLAFRDSRPLEDDPYFESYVSHSEVREILERLDCEHVLLIVDSCFAGTLDPLIAMAPGARLVDDSYGLIPAREYIQRKLRFKTRRYITAGGKEYVPDGRPGQHSPFVRQLLEGLRSYGGADGILTLEELTLYLERVDPQPRTGELFGNEPGSSFVFVARPPEEEAPAPRFAPLIVDVSPPDAQIRIAGGPPAAESLVKTLRVEAVGSTKRRYHLPLGTYEVTVSRAGYTTETHTVEMSAAGQIMSVRLRRE